MIWRIIKTHKEAITAFMFCLNFSILLFSWEYPPIADFMPHLGQIQSFWWEIKRSDNIYAINWWAPNTLYYYLLVLFNLIMPPITACKWLWVTIYSTQILALYRLQQKLKSSYANFLLCMVLSFNMNLYWGFGNYILACTILLYIIATTKRMNVFMKFVSTLLLAWSHIFILAPLTVYEIVAYKQFPREKRKWLHFSPLIVTSIWVLCWMVFDFTVKSKGALAYNFPIVSRISLEWLFQSIQGGIQSKAEVLVAVTVLSLIVFSIYKHIQISQANLNIILVGVAFFCIGIILPDKGMNTVRASQRWIPVAIQIFLLTLSTVPHRTLDRIMTGSTMLVSGIFILATWNAWHCFQNYDLSGLREAIDLIPKNSHLIVLDYVGFGENFQTRSVMHAGSYAQVIMGAIPQASFADNPAAFVRYRNPRTYSPNLEWYPNRITQSDVDQSDVMLIGGKPEVHTKYIQSGRLVPLNTSSEAVWRVYRIKKH